MRIDSELHPLPEVRRVPTKFTRGRENSQGMDLMRQISEGRLKPAPAKDVQEVKSAISDACEELIEIGARIRPLLLEDGKQIGWVRGLHLQERKIMKRWIQQPNDFVALTLVHATSFSREEIEAMQSEEITSLVSLVREMTDYDLALYPYLSAYATTQSSETLWYGKGDQLASFEHKIVEMPDGKK